MKKMRGLTEIGLYSNSLGQDSRGVNCLYSLLAHNPNIQYINLQDNNLNDTDAASLVKILLESTGLSSLDLRQNKIGNAGGVKILNALKQGKCVLKDIKLTANQIRQKTLFEINNILSGGQL